MNKNKQKLKRQLRVRSKIQGTKDRPRLSVFRSNKFIYAQLIDDEKGETLVGVSQKEVEVKDVKGLPAGRQGKIEKAKKIGLLLAKKAIEKKIKEAVFDRGGYAYHGRVESVAVGAREGGLKF